MIVAGGRRIGPGEPVFIIAEAGVNHGGDAALAHRLVDVAAACGADAVKFQTFGAERLASPEAAKAEYQRETTGAGESQLDMLRKLELSPALHRELSEHCRRAGVLFLSTPFDEESADLLVSLGVPLVKLASGEVTNFPLLRHVARKGLPIVLSTGMSTLAEVEAALGTLRDHGARELALLHCVSAYPADPADANLRAIDTLARALRVPVGWSDHTPGVAVALAAVAVGACIVEKHFTTDHDLPGPDHRASLEPDELRALVQGIRTVERSLGSGVKAPAAAEIGIRAVARRSLFAARAIEPGTTLEASHLRSLRPSGGIDPSLIDRVVGRRATRPIAAGARIAWSDLE